MLKNDMNSLGEVDTTKKKLKFFNWKMICQFQRICHLKYFLNKIYFVKNFWSDLFKDNKILTWHKLWVTVDKRNNKM